MAEGQSRSSEQGLKQIKPHAFLEMIEAGMRSGFSDEGFDLHFHFLREVKIEVLPPSRPAASNSPPDCCFEQVRIPTTANKKADTQTGICFFGRG